MKKNAIFPSYITYPKQTSITFFPILSVTTNFPVRYVWGNDLSTPQGTGGVGGLLVAIRGAAPFFPCHDANGEQRSAKGKAFRSPVAILRLARGSTRARARSGTPRRSGNCYITEYALRLYPEPNKGFEYFISVTWVVTAKDKDNAWSGKHRIIGFMSDSNPSGVIFSAKIIEEPREIK